MAEMMKAAVVHEFGAPLHIEGARIPAPGPGTDPSQGGCHTDLHAANGDWPVKSHGRTRNGEHRSDAFAR